MCGRVSSRRRPIQEAASTRRNHLHGPGASARRPRHDPATRFPVAEAERCPRGLGRNSDLALGRRPGDTCLLPGLAVHLGVDLSTRVEPFPQSGVGGLTPGQIALAVQAVARGSYTHTLLEWTAFCAASFVCLLTFVQYRLTREPSLPIIGVALLCAGTMRGTT